MGVLMTASSVAAKLVLPVVLVICLVCAVALITWVIRFIKRKPPVETCNHCGGSGECSCDYCHTKVDDEFACVELVPCGYCGGAGVVGEKEGKKRQMSEWPRKIWWGAGLFIILFILMVLFMAFHDIK